MIKREKHIILELQCMQMHNPTSSPPFPVYCGGQTSRANRPEQEGRIQRERARRVSPTPVSDQSTSSYPSHKEATYPRYGSQVWMGHRSNSWMLYSPPPVHTDNSSIQPRLSILRYRSPASNMLLLHWSHQTIPSRLRRTKWVRFPAT